MANLGLTVDDAKTSLKMPKRSASTCSATRSDRTISRRTGYGTWEMPVFASSPAKRDVDAIPSLLHDILVPIVG